MLNPIYLISAFIVGYAISGIISASIGSLVYKSENQKKLFSFSIKIYACFIFFYCLSFFLIIIVKSEILSVLISSLLFWISNYFISKKSFENLDKKKLIFGSVAILILHILLLLLISFVIILKYLYLKK